MDLNKQLQKAIVQAKHTQADISFFTSLSLKNNFKTFVDGCDFSLLYRNNWILFRVRSNLKNAPCLTFKSKTSLVAQLVKESAHNAGDLGLIPGLGRSPGEGNSYHSTFVVWRIPWTVYP